MDIKKALTLFINKPDVFALKSARSLRRALSRQTPSHSTLSLHGVRFDVDLSVDPAMMKRIYYKCYEVETEYIFRKFIKKGNTFLDIGANVGYLSALALSLVGTSGRVISFEPVPEYFERLNKLSQDNRNYRLLAHQFALGDREHSAVIAVTNLPNIGFNSMVPDFMSRGDMKKQVDVKVRRLDNYLREKGIEKVDFLKIDTEGYEFPVLIGFSDYLKSGYWKPIILSEVWPDAYPRLGFTLSQFNEYMKGFGFDAYAVPSFRKMDITKLNERINVLFIPKHH